jgi:hypothetical protein
MATERKDVLSATKQMIYQKRCLSRCSNRSTTLSNIPDGSQNQASAAIAPPVNDLLSRVTATIDIRKSTNPSSLHVSRIPPSNNNNEITPRTLPVEDLWEKASVVDSLFTVTRPFYRRTQIARVSLQAKNDFPVSQSVLEKAFEFCDSPFDMVISKDQNSRPSENNENVEISVTSKICNTTDVQSMNAVPLSVLNQKNQAALCSSAVAKKVSFSISQKIYGQSYFSSHQGKEKSPKVASYRQMSRVEDQPSDFGAEIGAFEFGTKRCAEDEARGNEATLSTKKNSNSAQLPLNIAGRPSRAGSRASQLSLVTKIRAAAVEKVLGGVTIFVFHSVSINFFHLASGFNTSQLASRKFIRAL